jgi:ADP-heptose:LPS heptosyltransferase
MEESAMQTIVEKIANATKPALFFYNAYGDHLLSRPAVLALQTALSGRLGYIGANGMVDMFYSDAQFRVVEGLAFRPEASGHRFDALDLLAMRESFDAIISLNWWHSDDMRQFIELAPDVPVLTLSSTDGYFSSIGADTHIADYVFKVPRRFNSSLEIKRFVSLPPSKALPRHLAKRFLASLPGGCEVLGIHTASKTDKQWPVEYFHELLERFLDQHPNFIALVVDPKDRGLDTGKFRDRIYCFDGIDLPTTTAIVEHCDVFVGIDSYFLHVADFAGIPSVGLFGPTSPVQWGCRFAVNRHVTEEKVSDIAVNDVLDALCTLTEALQ